MTPPWPSVASSGSTLVAESLFGIVGTCLRDGVLRELVCGGATWRKERWEDYVSTEIGRNDLGVGEVLLKKKKLQQVP